MLDRESGELVHWLILGDPRRTRDEGRRFLEAEGASLGELKEQWQKLLAECADEVDAVARETDLFVQEYQLSTEHLPTVLFLVPGSASGGVPLHLPPSVLDSIERAKAVFSVIREHLDRFARQRVAEGALVRLGATLNAALDELKQGPLGEELLRLPNDVKKYAVLSMVCEGRTVDDACGEVGISRQAIYADTRFGGLLREATDARRRIARGERLRIQDRRAASSQPSAGDE